MKGLPFFDPPAGRVGPGLPVRVSAVAEHEAYDKQAVALSDKVDVLLDGRVLPEVAGWDVVAGEVTRKCRDAAGSAVAVAGIPTYETLSGRVEVRWIREPEGHRHA